MYLLSAGSISWLPIVGYLNSWSNIWHALQMLLFCWHVEPVKCLLLLDKCETENWISLCHENSCSECLLNKQKYGGSWYWADPLFRKIMLDRLLNQCMKDHMLIYRYLLVIICFYQNKGKYLSILLAIHVTETSIQLWELNR